MRSVVAEPEPCLCKCPCCSEPVLEDTPEQRSALNRRMRREMPGMWCRIELVRLQDLLKTHVHLALETGQDFDRIVAFLDRVRDLLTRPTAHHQEQTT